MLGILADAVSRVFDGNVSCLWICRIMAYIAHKEFWNSSEDGDVLSRMSAHVWELLSEKGVTKHRLALQFSSELGKLLDLEP